MSETYICERGLLDSDDVEADVIGNAILIGAFDEENAIHARLDFDAALRLGTWLIAHAIAGGARPTSNPEPTP